MQQNETRDWTFRLRVDQQSTQQASQAIQRLLDRIDDLRVESRRLRIDSAALSKEFRTLGDVAEIPSVQRARDRIRDLGNELKAEHAGLRAYTEATEEYNAALERTATVADQAAEAQRLSKTYRGTAYNLNYVGSAVSLLSPGAARSLTVGSDLLQAADGLKNLREQLPDLVTQLGGATNAVGLLGGAGGALALGTLVLKGFNDEQADFRRRMEESRQVVREFLNAQMDLADFLATATQDEKEQKAQNLNEERLQAENRLREARADLAVLEPIMKDLTLKNLGPDSLKNVNMVLPSGTPIRSGTELFSAYDDLIGKEKQYTQELEINSLQTRKVTGAMFESGDTLSRMGDSVVSSLQGVIGTFNVLTQTTLPNLEKAAKQASRTVAGSSVLSRQGVGSVFGTPYGGAGGALLQAAVEAQTEREKTLADQIELTNQYLGDQAATEAKRALTLERDQEDADRKRAKDIASHYADLAQLDVTYYAKVGDQLEKMAEDAAAIDKQQVEELRDYAKESQRQAQDHQRRMLDIERGLDTGVEDAVEERSVAAAIRAVRQAKEQADDENDQYDTERERREEDFQDRLDELKDQRAEKLRAGQQALADLKQQHAQERTTRINDFWQRMREEDQERSIKRQRQQQDWAWEDMEQWLHYLKQQTKTATHWSTIRSLTDTGMLNVETTIQTRWNELVSGMASGQQPLQPLHGLHSFGTGGTPPLGRKVIVGDGGPEMAQFNRDGTWTIFNNRQTRQMMTNQPITVQLNMPMQTALDSASIETVFEQRVLPKLTRAVVQAQRQAGAH